MSKPLVVLLHGLFRTKLSMIYMSYRLRAAGFDTLIFSYPSRTSNISYHAESLSKFLKDHVEEGREINFVTHSLGSIIVRQFADTYYSEYKLGKIVMLGPPNQGSSFAKQLSKIKLISWFMGPSFVELCQLNIPNSSDKIKIYVVAGQLSIPFREPTGDGIVTIAETELEGMIKHVRLRGSHALLTHNLAVIDETIGILRS